MHKIMFAKLREGAVIPSKRSEDSDYDLYACFDEEELIIPPFSTRLVPTGIISAFDESLGVKFEERGSNTKWCGIVQAGVIDSGYRGEWFCAIYNGNSLPVHISKAVSDVQRLEDKVMVPYSKAVCQFNVRVIPKLEIQEVSPEAVLACASDRGTGALGSSGK
jgi:dUTP pyrophosphatase